VTAFTRCEKAQEEVLLVSLNWLEERFCYSDILLRLEAMLFPETGI
jgi:hypothetical protein